MRAPPGDPSVFPVPTGPKEAAWKSDFLLWVLDAKLYPTGSKKVKFPKLELGWEFKEKSTKKRKQIVGAASALTTHTELCLYTGPSFKVLV